jgi:putative flippase GtrA
LNINYLLSTAVAFIFAATTNYFMCRHFVFSKTMRRLDHGYYYFILISLVGLVYVVVLMAVFVEFFNFNYFISRTFVAGFVGMWNYLMNLFFNFKVYKIH